MKGSAQFLCHLKFFFLSSSERILLLKGQKSEFLRTTLQENYYYQQKTVNFKTVLHKLFIWIKIKHNTFSVTFNKNCL